MTEQQHPITPPPQLRRLWAQQAQRLDPHDPVAWMEHVSTQAARWGADQELEACCEYIQHHFFHGFATDLRAARRPKPSLKEQALAVIENSEICDHLSPEHAAILRRALEQLRTAVQHALKP